MREYELKDKHGHILKTHSSTKQVRRYLEKSMATQGKEAHKQLIITESLKTVIFSDIISLQDESRPKQVLVWAKRVETQIA